MSAYKLRNVTMKFEYILPWGEFVMVKADNIFHVRTHRDSRSVNVVFEVDLVRRWFLGSRERG